MQIVLDSTAFENLVNGKVAKVYGYSGTGLMTEVEVILSDIGFARMQELLDAAQRRRNADEGAQYPPSL